MMTTSKITESYRESQSYAEMHSQYFIYAEDIEVLVPDSLTITTI